MLPTIYANQVASWRLLSAVLIFCLTLSGCTSLGYYPENLVARKVSDSPDLVPDYKTVKTWAYDVQDGFDSRATINHYALEYGALIALAAAGTMGGLAIFSPKSDVLKGLPIGTAFLAGAAAYYDNHYRYDLYSKASDRVRELIDVTDERVSRGVSPTLEARCLKYEVGKVIETVKQYISYSDPNKLVAQLSSIKSPSDINEKLTPSDQLKLLELVKASGRDTSKLDPNHNLRTEEGYCKELNIPAPSGYQDETTLLDDAQLPRYANDAAATISSSLLKLSTKLIVAGTTTVDSFNKDKGNNAFKTASTDDQAKLQDATTKVDKLKLLLDSTLAAKWDTKFTETTAKVAATVTAFKNNTDNEKTAARRFDLIRAYQELKLLGRDISQDSDKIRNALEQAEDSVKAAPRK